MNKNIVKKTLLDKIKIVEHYSDVNIQFVDINTDMVDMAYMLDPNINKSTIISTLRLDFNNNLDCFEINDYTFGIINKNNLFKANEIYNSEIDFIRLNNMYFKENDLIKMSIHSTEKKEIHELINVNPYYSGEQDINFAPMPKVRLVYDHMVVSLKYKFILNNYQWSGNIDYKKMYKKEIERELRYKFSENMLFVAF